MKNFNIRTKLFILIFSILIPMIALHSYNIVSQYKRSVESELKANQDFAQAINSAFINFVERLWDTELAIGTAIISDPSLSTEDIEAYMKAVVMHQPAVLRYTWLNTEGIVIATTIDNPYHITFLSDRDYFERIKKGEDKIISPIIQGRMSEHIIMPVARGIWKDGKLEGIIVAAVDVSKLDMVMPEQRLGRTSSFGIIDSSGMFVYRSGSPDIPYENRRIPPDFPAWKALEGQVVKTYSRESIFAEGKRMGVDYPISNIGWACYAAISVDEVLEKYLKNAYIGIIVLLIVIAASFLTAVLLGREFLYSITSLKEASVSIFNGDLHIRTNIQGNDEIASAGKAFDRMAERIQHLEVTRNLFLQTAAHELRNPMTGIKNIASIVRKRIDNGRPINETLGMLEVLEKEVDRLAKLLNQILEAFKAQKSNLPIKADYNLVNIADVINSALRPYIAAEDHIYNFDSHINFPALVFGNFERLEDAIRNLVGNAAKYSPRGSCVDVGLECDSGYAVISVRDEGIGIPKDQITHIFDSFCRGSNLKGKDPGGMGLGLYISRDVTQKHGGTIWAENNSDKGSAFYIKLPLYTKQEGAKCNGTYYDY